MFIFDELKRSNERLRMLSIVVLSGLAILAAGLWYVQVVSGPRYLRNSQKQSFRSARVPALRGKIFDRNGEVLAEVRPRYNVNLYLEELPGQFYQEYTNTVLKEYERAHPECVKPDGTTKIALDVRNALKQQAAFLVVSNITWDVTSRLEQPTALQPGVFLKHYTNYTYVPFPVLNNLNPRQVARFAEQLSASPLIELEAQPARYYPHGSLAAHLLGYVRVQKEFPDEDIAYKYPSIDFQGEVGIEGVFDKELRGSPGVKWVLVNNGNYAQRQETSPTPEAGADLHLTIDLAVQEAAEKALAGAKANALGAAIVIDVRNGDVIAMASAPTFDPNEWVDGVSPEEWARLNDDKLKPMFNRVTFGAYNPGSTFKIITGLACLEAGLNPKEIYESLGYFLLGNSEKGDTAGSGPFDFDRAFYKSSNSYFINYGLKYAKTGGLLDMAKRFHLGERTGIISGQEVAGDVPPREKAVGIWPPAKLADACIGQEITVTPIQMAMMVAAVANGGTLFQPRVVSELTSPETSEVVQTYPSGIVRDHVRLVPTDLAIVRHAMLLDTENPEGSGYNGFHHADGSPVLKDFHVGAKTGTAQIIGHGVKDYNVWFVSYGPVESPRYAVVVMVEHGTSGARTCAKPACEIYQALIKREQTPAKKPANIAAN